MESESQATWRQQTEKKKGTSGRQIVAIVSYDAIAKLSAGELICLKDVGMFSVSCGASNGVCGAKFAFRSARSGAQLLEMLKLCREVASVAIAKTNTIWGRPSALSGNQGSRWELPIVNFDGRSSRGCIYVSVSVFASIFVLIYISLTHTYTHTISLYTFFFLLSLYVTNTFSL